MNIITCKIVIYQIIKVNNKSVAQFKKLMYYENKSNPILQ